MHEGEFRLTPSERTELRDRMRSRTLPAEDVRQARLILLLAQGKSYLTIRQLLGCNPLLGRALGTRSRIRQCEDDWAGVDPCHRRDHRLVERLRRGADANNDGGPDWRVRIATTRGQFAHFPGESHKPETRWRSAVNSNSQATLQGSASNRIWSV